MTLTIIKDEYKEQGVGYYIGINWVQGIICTNSQPMKKEEFMDIKGLLNELDVVGPFYDYSIIKILQKRIINFFKEWAKNKSNVGAVNLQDLFNQNQI